MSVPLKRMKTISPSAFKKNTNTLKKKKKQYLDIYTDGLKFSFDYSNETNEELSIILRSLF